MKKIFTAAVALLFCLSSFAASVKFADINIGMSKSAFSNLLGGTLDANGVVSKTTAFERFGDSDFSGLFIDDSLSELSITLISVKPSSFEDFDKKFKQVVAVVYVGDSIEEVSFTEHFTQPFKQGDGNEFQALRIGKYYREAKYQNDVMTVTISSGTNGIITINMSARAKQAPTDNGSSDNGSADNGLPGNSSADDITSFIHSNQEAQQHQDNADQDSNTGNNNTNTQSQQQSQGNFNTIRPSKEENIGNTPHRFSDKQALYFQGIRVEGAAANLAKQLERKGFTIVNDSNPDQIFVKGSIDGIDDCEIYIINNDNKLISSITVYYPAHTQWTSLESQYLQLKAKYDNDTQTFVLVKDQQNWENGYSFAGREMEAVKQDKCWYVTNYTIKNTKHKATLYISKYARVTLYYEVFQSTPSNSETRSSGKISRIQSAQ